MYTEVKLMENQQVNDSEINSGNESNLDNGGVANETKLVIINLTPIQDTVDR